MWCCSSSLAALTSPTRCLTLPALRSRCLHAAARTKLRKLLADREKGGASAGGGAAAGGQAAEPSPHAKSVYDAAEFESLVKDYEALKWRMISKPGGATVKPDDFYRYCACCGVPPHSGRYSALLGCWTTLPASPQTRCGCCCLLHRRRR